MLFATALGFVLHADSPDAGSLPDALAVIASTSSITQRGIRLVRMVRMVRLAE